MTEGDPRVLVLNGPNLGRLGAREPEVYGRTTYPELAALCVRGGAELGLAVQVRQTDSEAELLGWIETLAGSCRLVARAGAVVVGTAPAGRHPAGRPADPGRLKPCGRVRRPARVTTSSRCREPEHQRHDASAR